MTMPGKSNQLGPAASLHAAKLVLRDRLDTYVTSAAHRHECDAEYLAAGTDDAGQTRCCLDPEHPNFERTMSAILGEP